MNKQKYTKETEINKIYGFLKVLDFNPGQSNPKILSTALVQCLRCNSADPFWIRHTSLTCKDRPTTSCGCLQIESAKQQAKHNLSNHPYYHLVKDLIKRNLNKNNCFWTNKEDLIKYLDQLPSRQPGQILTRIDKNKNYEPGNLIWGPRS